jgi:hypothetical protein
MAQYKVPQDVEAEDKLLGPFSFRQFVYLLIAAGLIAVAVGLFQLFPLLAIIPLLPVLLFLALALPIKKDQPMETYLAALVSYYLKPRKRIWMPGQRESTITITAPKIVEENRTRNITGEEATHRLSFLADIVDTEGYAIKGAASNPMREDLIAEANATTDIFETGYFNNLENTIARDENERHKEVLKQMREAIEKSENIGFMQSTLQPKTQMTVPEIKRPEAVSPAVVMPNSSIVEKTVEKSEEVEPVTTKHSIMELANNTDFSVATIAKEANRIKERDEGEVFISLH